MRVGVLALQGCIDPHLEIISKLGLKAIKVIDHESLSAAARLILPGGESSTMLHLLEKTDLTEKIINYSKQNPTWGICAGAILLAKEVTNPTQRSFKAIDIRAERNSYGSQANSFKASIAVKGIDKEIAADFIRAPRLSTLSKDVEVLAIYNNDPVLLRQNNILVSAFHVELSGDTRLHQYFLGM